MTPTPVQRLRRLLKPRRGWVIAVPLLWLTLFFLLPFAIVLKISLSEAAIAVPPYQAILDYSGESLNIALNLGNYLFLMSDSLYVAAYWGSVKIALLSTVLCLLIGYPMAYAMARAPAYWQLVLLLLVMLPSWTSFLIRVYAWMGILGNTGLINNTLLGLGVIDSPIRMMNTNFAVVLGIVYAYLPFMVLPLYATLEKLDRSYLEASLDLGASQARTFFSVLVPLSMPGIVSGTLLVLFTPIVLVVLMVLVVDMLLSRRDRGGRPAR